MGQIRQWGAKATGADVQADIAERAAQAQAAATTAAAQAANKAAQEQAAQASRSMEANAARATAQAAAADAADKPVEDPDINIAGTGGSSASGVAKARRAKFGVGSAGSGVSI